MLKETSLKNFKESKEIENKKLNKIHDESDKNIDENDLMKQLNDEASNKSLVLHNYRIKQFANLSYVKLYHALINVFEIVPLTQNHQFGNFHNPVEVLAGNFFILFY